MNYLKKIENLMKKETTVFCGNGIFIEKAHNTILVGFESNNELQWIKPFAQLSEADKKGVCIILQSRLIVTSIVNSFNNEVKQEVKQNKK